MTRSPPPRETEPAAESPQPQPRKNTQVVRETPLQKRGDM
nr:MAG TPA: hypothetical protein [Caudoviricetes sp.]